MIASTRKSLRDFDPTLCQQNRKIEETLFLGIKKHQQKGDFRCASIQFSVQFIVINVFVNNFSSSMYSSQWFWHVVNQWQSIKVIIIQIERKIRNIYMGNNAKCRNRSKCRPMSLPVTHWLFSKHSHCNLCLNMARSANAVQCHSLLSGHYDCNVFMFAIVRNVNNFI